MEQFTPPLKLKALGALEVFDSQERRLKVKGQHLLLRMWAAGREGVSRTQAGADLWPDDDQPMAHAKLRVALGRLKQSLPSGFVLEQDGLLRLALDQIQSELEEGAQSLEKTLDEVDPVEGCAHAEEAIRWIESPLLPSLDAPWIQQMRAEWDDLREEAASCLVQQAKEAGRPEVAYSAAQAGLKVNPTNGALAEAGILALIQMGDLKGASLRLKAWEKSARELEPSFAFPPRLRRLALGGEPMGSVSEDQADLAASLVERLIQEDPEAALEFLGHRLLRKEVQTRPEAALPLLERALARSQLASEASHRCLGRAALAAGLMQDHEKAVLYGERALSLAQSLPLRKAIMISLSFDYYWLGQSREALRTVDGAIETAEQIGDKIDCEIAKCQRASFWMLEGMLEEAIQGFDRSIAALREIGKDEELPDMVTILHNSALAYAHAGRWKEGEDRLNECQVCFQLHRPKHLLPLLTPLRGLTLVMVGDQRRGAGILAKGVALACRNRHQKRVGTALLMAALALAQAGRRAGAGLILSAAEAEIAREKALPSRPQKDWIATLKRVVEAPPKPLALVDACRLAVAELRLVESGDQPAS